MRPPGFWFTPPDAPGLRARLLAPLGWLQARRMAHRMARPGGWRAPLPVICVGTLDAVGSDTTSTVQTLALHLQARGRRPTILMPGQRGPVAVDPQHHTAEDVGDAALLTAAFAPTWAARHRAAGARAIVRAAEGSPQGTDCILMADGVQDPYIVKDLTLIVADAVTGFGNGRSLPAGPLYEPVGTALARADLLVSIGPPAAQKAFDRAWRHVIDIPKIRARMEALQTGMDWRGARVLAFAGIAHPQMFFGILRGLGTDLVRAEALEEHQPLTVALMTRLDREAKLLGAQLVTTEKDAVRLPPAFRRNVLTLPVRLQLEDPAPLDAALDRVGL
ncbi:tetraacyldisaccharide 4'-kinase [Roseovarius sp. D22-M7]|uniref:tetraacyldisaccharide 4'-kinase n=1 Tax=Roseovarius sp. D22-M7 TaxID=3127116 RepID=UPI0030103663